MSTRFPFADTHAPVSLLDPEDQAILRVLEHDWRRLCGLDVAVAHDAVNPVQMDRALPHAYILHRVAPGVARFRVAGQRVHDAMRLDPRGMSFTALFAERQRDTVMALLDHAFEAPAVLGLPLVAPRGLGRKPVRAEALLLPMRDAQGNLTRMMGALVASGPLPQRALRFEIARDQTIRCDTLAPGFADRRARRGRQPEPSQRAALLTTPPAPSLAAATAAAERGRPALTLVVDNT